MSDLLENADVLASAFRVIGYYIIDGYPEDRAVFKTAQKLDVPVWQLARLWRKNKKRVGLPEARNILPLRCVYCGEPPDTYWCILPIYDFRRKIVWAHDLCIVYEMLVAGNLEA